MASRFEVECWRRLPWYKRFMFPVFLNDEEFKELEDVRSLDESLWDLNYDDYAG